jgi:hypothetical protein
MRGGIGTRRSAASLSGRRQQPLEQSADRPATADGTREQVTELLRVIFLVVTVVLDVGQDVGPTPSRCGRPVFKRSCSLDLDDDVTGSYHTEARGEMRDLTASERDLERGERRVDSFGRRSVDHRKNRSREERFVHGQGTVRFDREVPPGRAPSSSEAIEDVGMQTARCQQRRLHG